MLYIRRRVDSWQVEVMDTDDGAVETIMNDELCAHADAYGLEIIGLKRSGFRLEHIIPYQPPDKIVKTQAKLLTLCNIRLLMCDQELTGIMCQDMNITKGMRLRLSDVCSKVGACVLSCNTFSGSHSGGLLTLIFDDKLALHNDSLFFAERVFFRRAQLDDYLRLDVRELSGPPLKKLYYWVAHLDRAGHTDANKLIVDWANRKMRMIKSADREVLEEISHEERDNMSSIGW